MHQLYPDETTIEAQHHWLREWTANRHNHREDER